MCSCQFLCRFISDEGKMDENVWGNERLYIGEASIWTDSYLLKSQEETGSVGIGPDFVYCCHTVSVILYVCLVAS